MAGPVVAGDLPPLLPTPTTTTSCVSLRPPSAPYTFKKAAAMAVVAGRLPSLLPTPTKPPPAQYASKKPAGRASLSGSWLKDKITGGGVLSDQSQDSGRGGVGLADGNGGKVPGRASLSSSWVEDKLLGRAGTSTSGVERASRPTWRDGWNGSKRAASRAPSDDRSEKKAKPPTDEEEEDDALESETQQYAGPTFVLSPDPSELPIPLFFLKAH